MSDPVLPADRLRRLTGYGMASGADGYVFRPASEEGIREALTLARRAGRKVTLRGAARSYGDANFGAECVVIDLTRFDRILGWDSTTGIIEAEAGATLLDVWHKTLEDGWWLPVVSGTAHPTLGGALAMNIHGKNDYCAGTLGEHIESFDAMLPSGEVVTARRGDSLWAAIIGSAGLLAIILRVKLQMKRVTSGDLIVHAHSMPNWDAQFDAFERHREASDYMVSWIDCFAGGKRSGRGLLHTANYPRMAENDNRTLSLAHQELPETILGVFPKSAAWRLLRPFNNRAGMRAINWAKYTLSRLLADGKTHHQSLAEFSFLLDSVPNWRKAYEPAGFIQYQAFVPKEAARHTFALLVEQQRQARYESFLAVMKRHRPDPFLISCNLDGYSLALDFKVRPKRLSNLRALARRMTEAVLEAGGRFYWAKDSLLEPADARRYLGPAHERLIALKHQLDPEHLLTHELAHRLRLFESPDGPPSQATQRLEADATQG